MLLQVILTRHGVPQGAPVPLVSTLLVGADPSCALRVLDPECGPRSHRVTREGNGASLYSLGTRRSRQLTPGVAAPLSAAYALMVVAAPADDVAHADGANVTRSLTQLRPVKVEAALIIGVGPSRRRVRLAAEWTTFGQQGHADVAVHDPAVSRRHFRARADVWGRGVELEDLGSRNGLVVLGDRLERGFVSGGARITVGRTRIDVFVCAAEAPDKVRDAGAWVGSGAEKLGSPSRADAWIANSPPMQAAVRSLERYGRLSAPLMIAGESGSGKEGAARLAHRASGRTGPFVAVNCGALGDTTLASALFGHVRGAFTGADRARRGAFVTANGGTLFLDEIGDLSPAGQVALLRVLETRQVRPVGADETVTTTARVVTATHRKLQDDVTRGRFRADLYYRLTALAVTLPPLRERPECLASLVQHLSREASVELGRPLRWSPSALSVLRGYDWPGNVRELRALVLRVGARAGTTIEAADVKEVLGELLCATATCSRDPQPARVNPADLRILEALEEHGGNKAAAARSLGMRRTTLRDRIRRIERRAGAPAEQGR